MFIWLASMEDILLHFLLEFNLYICNILWSTCILYTSIHDSISLSNHNLQIFTSKLPNLFVPYPSSFPILFFIILPISIIYRQTHLPNSKSSSLLFFFWGFPFNYPLTNNQPLYLFFSYGWMNELILIIYRRRISRHWIQFRLVFSMRSYISDVQRLRQAFRFLFLKALR